MEYLSPLVAQKVALPVDENDLLSVLASGEKTGARVDHMTLGLDPGIPAQANETHHVVATHEDIVCRYPIKGPFQPEKKSPGEPLGARITPTVHVEDHAPYAD